MNNTIKNLPTGGFQVLKFKTPTLEELQEMGFKISEHYERDNLITQERAKGILTTICTYDKLNNFKKVQFDVMIGNNYIPNISFTELKQLDNILNK